MDMIPCAAQASPCRGTLQASRLTQRRPDRSRHGNLISCCCLQVRNEFIALESPYPERMVAVLHESAQMVDSTGRPAPESEVLLRCSHFTPCREKPLMCAG